MKVRNQENCDNVRATYTSSVLTDMMVQMIVVKLLGLSDYRYEGIVSFTLVLPSTHIRKDCTLGTQIIGVKDPLQIVIITQ